MKTQSLLILLTVFSLSMPFQSLLAIEKPEGKKEKLRVIMTSDFPPIGVVKGGDDVPNTRKSDPDDMQSMVRFLLYANEFDVEGLVASAGTFAMVADKNNILGVLDEYEKVYDNLKTYDPDYPSADYLRSVTFEGRGNNHGLSISFGCGKQDYTEIIGKGLDSEASNAIIAAAYKPDPRPLWIGVWGGPREVAQAIWDVKNRRSEEELEAFISKLRVFLIYCQDSSHEWLRKEFPDLFMIESIRTYQGMFGGSDPGSDLAWINENIRFDHGPLCSIYPHEGVGCTGVCEGDSPAFLYLVSANRGINNPEDPTQESWGGQYVRVENTNHYTDGPGGSSISKWRDNYQKEFKDRADWCIKPRSETALNRPRVINTTDLGADPDDEQSMVRQLVSANEFDIVRFERKVVQDSLISQAANWNYQHTIRAPICNLTSCKHHKKRWLVHLLSINLITEFNQVGRSFFNLFISHFYLNWSPATIIKFYDYIRFKT